MAQIDVSFLMNDPDFVNKFTITRRATTVNSHGRNEITETTINAVGSIQATDQETLLMLPEAARSVNFITVYTKTQMITDEAGQYSDIANWKGRRYAAKACLPWDNFGAGWYMCLCEMEKASNG